MLLDELACAVRLPRGRHHDKADHEDAQDTAEQTDRLAGQLALAFLCFLRPGQGVDAYAVRSAMGTKS
jgi:hypothetical protein